ncbi:MAG: shikimate dehydrogenase [Gammaproteobacteria bacterium]|nr:shikimate dehydrogenase [Gammaproteobacteria bacterium]
MSEIAKYAVMGNPVGHSLSPRIHQMFAEQCGISLEYSAIHVELGEFESAVTQFRDGKGKGLNITVPFKLEAWQLADVRSARAELAGAVNTLKFAESGDIFGDNTDGIGMLRDISVNLGKALKNAKVLVIGAGGAVRGVLGPLQDAKPSVLHIVNRTASKAKDLANIFTEYGLCTASGLNELEETSYDIVINGTAASLQGKVPDLPASIFADNALAYDVMYSKDPTSFLVWAGENGASQLSDGLGMLVEQAAESFYLWHGVKPETKQVIQALR